MLPQQKKPLPLMPSTSSNVVQDVVMADGKGPETRKRDRSPLPSDSEKGNKRKSPRKMHSSPFLAAATGHFFQAARSLSSSSSGAAVAAPGTSPKADGTIGVRNGDTGTSPNSSTTNPTASSKGDNNAEMETVKVISRAVRQRVAQSSSSSAASAISDTVAPARTVEVECTSQSTSSAPTVPPAPSSSSSKSPFKKRRRVVKTERKSSPLRNPPLLPSDFLTASLSSPASSTAPSKEKKVVKRKPVVWEKRPLLQKVLLKEFERTPHGAEILRRGAKLGIAFLEEQRHLVRGAEQDKQSRKSGGRKSTSSDEGETVDGVVVKSKSKEVSSMKHWGRIVKTALAGPLKEMAGPMAGDGRPPIMIRAW